MIACDYLNIRNYLFTLPVLLLGKESLALQIAELKPKNISN